MLALAPVVAIQRCTSRIAHPDRSVPLVFVSKRPCRGMRQVDYTVADIGTAVVDADHDRAAGRQIGHVGVAWQRQCRVRGRQRMHIEDFAVRSFAPVEVVAVP